MEHDDGTGMEKCDVRAFDAIMLGAHALVRMAYVVEQVRMAMASLKPDESRPWVAESVARHEGVLLDLARQVDRAMQDIGDYINNCDAVDSLTEPSTEAAFVAMRLLLGDEPASTPCPPSPRPTGRAGDCTPPHGGKEK